MIRLIRRLLAGCSALLWRRRADDELDRELRAYLDTAIEHKVAAGMTPARARQQARAEIGSLAATTQLVREGGWEASLEALLQDIRYASRSLWRHRAFTGVAALTLALGIGANTAMFSVINAVLLRPLPYPDADRLVRVMAHLPAAESPTRAPQRARIGLSHAELQDLREHTRAFSAAAISTLVFATWVGEDRTVRLEGARVSPALFAMLGVHARLGRLFTNEDERATADDVIVLSHAMWRRHFGEDPSVLGRLMTLEPQGLGNAFNSAAIRTYTVVGVAPETFTFDGDAQFWVPFKPPAASERPPRGVLIGLLAPGITAEAAAADLRSIIAPMRKHSAAVQYEVVPEQDEQVASIKPALLVLMGAVGLVLLIACVNVANLLLARTATRHHEIAVRTALGAGRARIVRHLLAESVLLAFAGGTAGIVLALGGIRLLQALAATLTRIDVGVQSPFPRFDAIAVDGRVLAFTVLTAVTTGLLFGLGPALRYSRARPSQVLHDRTTTADGRSRSTQNVLVLTEVAMAVVLLVGAGLLIHSFVRLTTVDLGYRAANVLTFQVAMPQRTNTALIEFSEELTGQLRSLPGVQAAAYARQLPNVQIQESTSFRRTPAVPEQPGPSAADVRLIGGNYFEMLGVRVVSGRGLTAGDGAGQPRVLVINETLARREFSSGQAVGQQVYVGRDALPWHIVGVVADVRQFGPERPSGPQFFADIRQWPVANEAFFGFLGPYYAVRTDGNAAIATAAIEQVLRRIHPNATLHNVATLESLVENSVSRPRLYSVLLGLFAAIAASLAAIGVYGVMAYSVGQRVREIGIRLALGAGRWQIVRMVIRQSAMVSGAGIALGIAGAAALTRYLEGLLFGVTPLDAVTFAAVAGLFASIAAVAAYVPARRATRIAPLVALRSE